MNLEQIETRVRLIRVLTLIVIACAVTSIGGIAIDILSQFGPPRMDDYRFEGILLFTSTGLTGSAALIAGVVAFATGWRLPPGERASTRRQRILSLVLGIVGGLTSAPGWFALLDLASRGFRPPCGPACEGRPLRIAGKRVATPAAASRQELESVPAFARLSLDLVALGAPLGLVAGCHRAALDEIAHARLRARHENVPVDDRGIPALLDDAPRAVLARLALESWIDGCLGEGAAAREAAAKAQLGGPDAAMHARIAEDEARHAELAWSVLAWTLSRDPSIGERLRRIATTAPDLDRERLERLLTAHGTDERCSQ